MSVPATRSLETVLREGLSPEGNQLRVLAGTFGPPSSDARYANVVVNGQSLRVPNLNAQPPGAPGQLVYLLADDSHMWVLGTMASVTSFRMNVGTANAVFNNANQVDGAQIAHGLPVTPRAVFLQPYGPTSIGVGGFPQSVTASTIFWAARTWSGAQWTGTAPFYWIAIG